MQAEGTRAQVQDFERDVMPVVVKLARKRFHDEEREAIALALCWYQWSRRKADYPPGHWARLACRCVYCGRDLPIDANSQRDVWARLERWEGAGMESVRDRGRNVVDEIISQDEVDRLESMLTPREVALLRLIVEGESKGDAARIIGVHRVTISQMIASVFQKWVNE